MFHEDIRILTRPKSKYIGYYVTHLVDSQKQKSIVWLLYDHKITKLLGSSRGLSMLFYLQFLKLKMKS